MLDPVTAISAATAAYNAIKQGIVYGRELQDMGSQLASWGRAISDLNFMEDRAKNPSALGVLFGPSQNDAIEIFAAKKKAEAQRKELKTLIGFTYGASAWDEFLAIEARVRKQQQEVVYRKERMKETAILWIVGALIVVSGVGGLVFAMYFLGKSQGKW